MLIYTAYLPTWASYSIAHINRSILSLLYAKNYQWEHPIRSVTVRAINLFEEDCPIQYDLFTDVKSLDRQERLDAAIEQIRFRFGKDAIKNGVLFQKSKMPTERKVDLVMPTGMIG